MSTTSSAADIQQMLGRTWGAVLAFGLATIALGVMILVWPQASVVTFAVLAGIYLIVSGIFQLVESFSAEGAPTGARVMLAISGALGIALGLLAFRSVAQAVAILGLLIGFAWLFRGIGEIIAAASESSMPDRGWVIVMGVVSVLAGIVLIVWPIASVATLVWVSGLFLVVLGLFEVIGAFRLRSQVRSLSA